MLSLKFKKKLNEIILIDFFVLSMKNTKILRMPRLRWKNLALIKKSVYGANRAIFSASPLLRSSASTLLHPPPPPPSPQALALPMGPGFSLQGLASVCHFDASLYPGVLLEGSIRGSVCQYVGWSVPPSIGWSVRPSVSPSRCRRSYFGGR